MLTIHEFLRPEEVGEINRLMDAADFDDGRTTAHGLAARAKTNHQVSRSCSGSSRFTETLKFAASFPS
jgi:predicted 2-oxoglutarate/Fe(II)-dependent dioxygenase YbiX